MGTKVHLYSNLQRYTAGQSIVEVEGDTVGDCLKHLVHLYPQLDPVIFYKTQSIFPHVYISVNLKSAKSEQFDRKLTPGDEIYIVLIVAGG